MSKKLKIRASDVLRSSQTPINYIVDRLQKAGAPIKRKSLTKVKITEDDIEITGTLRLETCPKFGDITYFWD